MTKIDETKQYKFSEIVRMVEEGELPEGTRVSANGAYDYLVVGKKANINKLYNADGNDIVMFNLDMLFSRLWTIKLPKEDKYYLKAPEYFERMCAYLNYNKWTKEYSLESKGPLKGFRIKFTQSEIDAMPFDTNFFEKIKVEDE